MSQDPELTEDERERWEYDKYKQRGEDESSDQRDEYSDEYNDDEDSSNEEKPYDPDEEVNLKEYIF